jgi:hypothetical protein
MRDLQHNRPVREESPRRLAVIGQVMRAIPLARRMA